MKAHIKVLACTFAFTACGYSLSAMNSCASSSRDGWTTLQAECLHHCRGRVQLDNSKRGGTRPELLAFSCGHQFDHEFNVTEFLADGRNPFLYCPHGCSLSLSILCDAKIVTWAQIKEKIETVLNLLDQNDQPQIFNLSAIEFLSRAVTFGLFYYKGRGDFTPTLCQAFVEFVTRKKELVVSSQDPLLVSMLTSALERIATAGLLGQHLQKMAGELCKSFKTISSEQ